MHTVSILMQYEVSLSRYCLIAWDYVDLQDNGLLRASEVLNMPLRFLFSRTFFN